MFDFIADNYFFDHVLDSFSYIIITISILCIVEILFLYFLYLDIKKPTGNKKTIELGIGAATTFLGATTILIGFSTYNASLRDASVDLFVDNKTHFSEIRKLKSTKPDNYYEQYWEHSFQEWFSSVKLDLAPKLWSEYYKYAVYTAAHRHLIFPNKSNDKKYAIALCQAYSNPVAFGGRKKEFKKAMTALYRDPQILKEFYKKIYEKLDKDIPKELPENYRLNCEKLLKESSVILSCTAEDIKKYRLSAQAWMNSSSEYYLLTTQLYGMAEIKLKENIAQYKKKKSNNKWAVIMDADETILDNSPYDTSRALKGLGWEKNSFKQWCEKEEARLLPGAYNFVRFVNNAGGSVFVVTDRDKTLNKCTVNNFIKLGLEVAGVYTKSSAEDQKSNRWSDVNDKGYEILLWVGDQITDFPIKEAGFNSGILNPVCKLKDVSNEAIEDFVKNKKMESFEHYTDSLKSNDELGPLSAKEKLNFEQCNVLLPNPSYGQWVKNDACVYKE